MALIRQFDEADGTVQITYAGEPITPKMRVDDAKELLEGLSAALEKAYLKIRDTKN